MKALSRKLLATGLFAIAFCGLMLTACGPTDKQRAESAEKKRIECLDKLCEGDIEPKRDYTKEAALKLNGQWYIGPNAYYTAGRNGAVFYWPTKAPGFAPGDFPKGVKGHDFDDIAIELFLGHHDGVIHRPNRIDNLKQAEAEGRLVSKKTIRPGLDQWHIKNSKGREHGVWYVATEQVGKEPNASVLWCDDSDPKFDSCTVAEIWSPGIAWDARLKAVHAHDWPEIHQEITRVLALLKKAQP